MNEIIAGVTFSDVGVVGLCILGVLAFVRRWVYPRSVVVEMRADHATQAASLKSSYEAVIAFQTAALATERDRGDELRSLNLRIMGYVEAAMTAPAVHSSEEAS